MEKKYVRIPFKNAYVGVSSKVEFKMVLEKIKVRLETLNIKRVWLNHKEVISVPYAIGRIKEMPVCDVLDSEIQIELK